MTLSRKLATLIIEEKATVTEVTEALSSYKLLSLLPLVLQAVKRLTAAESAYATVAIESPFPVSGDAVSHIKRIVGNDLADHTITINQSLLAGFKARFRGKLYDGSAERIIKQLTN